MHVKVSEFGKQHETRKNRIHIRHAALAASSKGLPGGTHENP